MPYLPSSSDELPFHFLFRKQKTSRRCQTEKKQGTVKEKKKKQATEKQRQDKSIYIEVRQGRPIVGKESQEQRK